MNQKLSILNGGRRRALFCKLHIVGAITNKMMFHKNYIQYHVYSIILNVRICQHLIPYCLLYMFRQQSVDIVEVGGLCSSLLVRPFFYILKPLP